jgi:hypothetical protein
VPFETTVLGAPVTVERVDLNRSEQIVVVCSRGRSRQSLPILDLPPRWPGGAERIEAYRRWRGEGRPTMAKKKLPQNLQDWVEARKRFHLSHAHVQMARELGRKKHGVERRGVDGD